MKRNENGEAQVARVIISVCAHCRRVRDDHGCWKEARFARVPADAEFSHGICSMCGPVLYPNLYKAAMAGD